MCPCAASWFGGFSAVGTGGLGGSQQHARGGPRRPLRLPVRPLDVVLATITVAAATVSTSVVQRSAATPTV